jgi:cephalosporin hydroxylase
MTVVDHIEHRLDDRLGDYYVERIRTHMDESYVGIPMRKFPEDLQTFERILWEGEVDVVLEVGTGHGGSALWFRDRLRVFAAYRGSGTPLVVTIDRNLERARQALPRVDARYHDEIKLIEGDIRDERLVDEVGAHIPPGARVLVVEDSAHMYDTTMAALRRFANVVPPNGFFVVEDGHRDYPGMLPDDMPSKVNGALVAVDEWLRSPDGSRFVVRRDLEKYVVTSNPRGWLQRVG